MKGGSSGEVTTADNGNNFSHATNISSDTPTNIQIKMYLPSTSTKASAAGIRCESGSRRLHYVKMSNSDKTREFNFFTTQRSAIVEATSTAVPTGYTSFKCYTII